LRVAVVSDVHANLHALEAVLAEIDGNGFDELWCLGDLVGYGPRPNECAALVRDRAAVCLAGNHDLVVLGKIHIDAFAGEAAAAAAWTRDVLDEAAHTFLNGLRPQATARGVALFHGSARDPVWEYVLTAEAARATFALADADLILVGHSHVALEISAGDALRGGTVAAGAAFGLGAVRRILNPGSVGQPRDGDPRAAWLEIDDDARRATFRRTEYPVARTQAEMREAGLPTVLASRLEHGV
jgi:diadenosine tetraphosphatase ApaH/serine/threonine PP2A family protein phosphatase